MSGGSFNAAHGDWIGSAGAILHAVLDWRLFSFGGTPITPGGLLWLVLIVAAGWYASRLIRRLITRLIEKRQQYPGELAALYTVGRIAHYTILSVALLVGFSAMGLDFSKLALIAGGLGVGIGFGLQNIVGNFVSGLILLFDRSIKVGDYLELETGLRGEVQAINTRFTHIRTNDNIDVLVPNSQLISNRLINWTMHETLTRLHVPFGVAYGSDKETVKQAALEAAEKVRFTLRGVPGRQPEVWLVNFGESSLDFELLVWLTPDGVHRPERVKACYLWELETALAKHRIEIPFPQRDLHIRTPPPG